MSAMRIKLPCGKLDGALAVQSCLSFIKLISDVIEIKLQSIQ
jgi:hypothetical protein